MTEFTRIFLPRTEKAVKAISLLTNGVRYKPTAEETTAAFDALKGAVNDLAEAYGILPTVKEVVEPEAPDEGSLVEVSRIDAKVDAINRSLFARGDVGANVMAIPENQVTAYATQILARLCGKFEEAEAQPKNFKPKEEEEE